MKIKNRIVRLLDQIVAQVQQDEIVKSIVDCAELRDVRTKSHGVNLSIPTVVLH